MRCRPRHMCMHLNIDLCICVIADILSQTKLRERELRESHKLEIQAEKEAKAAEREAARAMLRAERMMHDTKRAHKDRRRMEKREKAREAAEQRPVCEHGIKNCRLCFH